MWMLPESLYFYGLFLLEVFLVILLVYYYGTKTYGFWKDRGIPYIQPKYPFLGNFYETAFSMKPTHVKQLEYYKYFKNERFGGIFNFQTPELLIRDPALIESILIKDFTSFYNRGTGVDTKLDPLSAHLVNLEDAKWKNLRQKLTPTFSSGKLKGMHQQLVDCADELVEYCEDIARKAEPLDAREVMAKFSTDVIGSCAFGLNTNALKNPDSEFRKIGRTIFKPTFINRLRTSIRANYPLLLKLLSWRGLSSTNRNFFINMVQSTVKYREENNVQRKDFLQLLMELRKQDIEKMKNGYIGTDQDMIFDEQLMTANAVVFFVAGFETTASTLGYCLYELSINQDIQEEAYEHVLSVIKKHDGEMTYEAMKDMTFLEEILSETLRLHPPAVAVRRKATKAYKIPGTSIVLPKGTMINVPIYSLHHDPQYFPEPEKFMPKRFSKEYKDNIVKGTYMPFGDGPRICIGMRFAKMEAHLALAKLLLKYKFSLNEKTSCPLIYSNSSLLLTPKNGIWLDIQKR